MAGANRVQGPRKSLSRKHAIQFSRKNIAHIIENTARVVDERADNYYLCMNAPARTRLPVATVHSCLGMLKYLHENPQK